MTINQGMIIIIIATIVVIGIGILRKNMELLINFILRVVVGILAIYFLNEFFAMQKLSIAVGINPLTILTTGILGLPGLALLYGIVIYKFL